VCWYTFYWSIGLGDSSWGLVAVVLVQALFQLGRFVIVNYRIVIKKCRIAGGVTALINAGILR
jgi:hypothetical protein